MIQQTIYKGIKSKYSLFPIPLKENSSFCKLTHVKTYWRTKIISGTYFWSISLDAPGCRERKSSLLFSPNVPDRSGLSWFGEHVYTDNSSGPLSGLSKTQKSCFWTSGKAWFHPSESWKNISVFLGKSYRPNRFSVIWIFHMQFCFFTHVYLSDFWKL